MNDTKWLIVLTISLLTLTIACIVYNDYQRFTKGYIKIEIYGGGGGKNTPFRR